MAEQVVNTSLVSAEFTDKLSERLLLAPDVDFVFARWAYSAAVQQGFSQADGFDLAAAQLRDGRIGDRGNAANIDEAMSMGMGGPLLISMGMAYPDMFVMVQEAKLSGDTIKINRPRFIDGATTESSRILTPVNKLFGTNSQGFTVDQVAVVLKEYGGPGDASGNVVPISLAEFTRARSEHDLLRMCSNHLRRDRHKLLDDITITRLIASANAHDVTDGTGNVTRGGGVTANASFTGSGNEPFSFDLLVRGAEALKTRKVPGIALGTRWVLVLDQHQYADLELDPMFQRLSSFHPEYNPLFPGYRRDTSHFIICESNRMPRLTASIGGATTAYQGLAIAPGIFGWASGMAANARRDRNDDGGRFDRFAWLAHEGFQVLQDTYAQLFITD